MWSKRLQPCITGAQFNPVQERAVSSEPSSNLHTSRAADLSPPLALFVDRRNTGTSIMAEAILRHHARGRIRAASAGERASPEVSRSALECLASHGIGTEGLHSKAWGQFFGLGRPAVRFVVTLDDVYAAKAAWPPGTVVARWYLDDPNTIVGDASRIRGAFEATYVALKVRINLFLELACASLDDHTLGQKLADIGAR
jgi:protein-tyrosine-phosphatase